MENHHKLIAIYPLFLATILTFCSALKAQQPVVIKSYNIYQEEVQKDGLKKMVELKSLIPALKYDLRYATAYNFTHTKLYKRGNRTFLRLPVAMALKEVESVFNALGFGLRIFDGYRPFSVSVKMWQIIQDPRYVADPSKGSGHNRGLAVDITLYNLKTGKEVDMGTGFDNFTDSAHHDFKYLSEEVLRNRKLLKDVMESHGFNALETEWWHYSLQDARQYEILDLSFEELSRHIKK